MFYLPYPQATRRERSTSISPSNHRLLLIKVTLPPLDRHKRFHLAYLLSIFSRIKFHIVLSLNLALKGRPKYFIRRVPCLQPRIFSNNSILCTTSTRTNYDLPRFIFGPETTLNQIRTIWRIRIWSRLASQKLECHPQRGDKTPPRIFPLNYPHENLTCNLHGLLYPTFFQGLPWPRQTAKETKGRLVSTLYNSQKIYRENH